MDRWSPRLARVRLRVEDGLVTIEVSGVLDAHAAAMVRAELQAVCGLAKTVALDLRAVCRTDLDVGLHVFLDEAISQCRPRRGQIHVIAPRPESRRLHRSWR